MKKNPDIYFNNQGKMGIAIVGIIAVFIKNY